jgi:hypothetical protein
VSSLLGSLSSLFGGTNGAQAAQNAPGGLIGLFNTAGGRGGFLATAAKREKLQPTLRQEATREKLWFGPFTLPGVDVTCSLSPIILRLEHSNLTLHSRPDLGSNYRCKWIQLEPKLRDSSAASALTAQCCTPKPS